MSKAYTYADFISESMNYQHSQEYYGFMKEMAEIELMESYLTTQQFLAEEAGYYDFTEGVLMEAGDTDSVKTKLSEKAKSLLKKIIEGIKKAWNVFVKFITSIPDIPDLYGTGHYYPYPFLSSFYMPLEYVVPCIVSRHHLCFRKLFQYECDIVCTVIMECSHEGQVLPEFS